METSPVQNISKIWNNLTKGSVNRQILGAALIVALGTAFVKVAAVTKELVVAWRFGTGDDLDAFLIAFLVPSFFITVIAGSFNAALVPTYIQVREREGQKAAQRLFSGASVWGLGLLLSTTILIVLAAPVYLPWLAKGFDHQKLDLTVHLLYAISPTLLLFGIISNWGAVLNAGEHFALAALSPIITPIITILFLFGLRSWGIFTLPAGLVCGAALEIILLGYALHHHGISLLPRWYGIDTHFRQVVNQYIPMIAGAFLMSSSSLVDQSMAAMLSPGSVAALNYGNRVIALPLTLATTALSAAVIPYFSKMTSSEDWTEVGRTLKHFMWVIFVTTIPLTGLLIVFSDSIVQILFQRGSFETNDTQIVSQIQACFALQIPFYLGGILVVKLFSAIRQNHILMYGAIINLLANIGLNYLFIKIMGISGIALSTSCVYMISFSFLSYYWWRISRNGKSNG